MPFFQNKEQELVTTTQIHFDFIDRLKILCGVIPVVEVKVVVPQKEEIPLYNGYSKISFLRKTKSKFGKDKPDFGYIMPTPPQETER